jgi:hypothetical protein
MAQERRDIEGVVLEVLAHDQFHKTVQSIAQKEAKGTMIYTGTIAIPLLLVISALVVYIFTSQSTSVSKLSDITTSITLQIQRTTDNIKYVKEKVDVNSGKIDQLLRR